MSNRIKEKTDSAFPICTLYGDIYEVTRRKSTIYRPFSMILMIRRNVSVHDGKNGQG